MALSYTSASPSFAIMHFFYTRSDLTGHDFQFIGGSWVIDHMFLLDILYSSLFGAHLQGINGTVYPRHSPAKRYDRF
jgi:hypothetical protein